MRLSINPMNKQGMHDLLKDCALVSDKRSGTHIVTGDKEYNIRTDQIEEFWYQYIYLYEQGKDEDIAMYICEKSTDNSPFILEFNIEYSSKVDIPLPNLFIENVVKCVQEVMQDKLDIERDSQLYCVVLTSSTDKGDRNNGRFRLQFPYCRLQHDVQKKLRSEIIKLLYKNHYTKDLKSQPLGKWEEVLDQAIPFNYIPMAGYNYGYNALEYFNTYKYDDGEVSDIDIIELWNIDNHQQVSQGFVRNPQRIEDIGEDFSEYYYIPMLLSIYYHDVITLTKASNENTSRSTSSVCGEYINVDIVAIDHNLGLAESFIQLINQTRWSEDYSWLEIGKSLFTITDGSDEGLEIWSDYTEKYTNHGRDECELNFINNNFTNNPYTIRTLAWYAYLDNEDDFKQWNQEWVKESLKRYLQSPGGRKDNHVDVADIFYRQYWLNFIYSNNHWYYFDKHRWNITPNGRYIHDEIGNGFFKMLNAYTGQLNKLRGEYADNQNEQEKIEKEKKRTEELISKLKNTSFKNSLVKELSNNFQRDNFDSIKNNNDMLFAVKNGVIDVSSDKFIFREGRPEDYITVHSPIMYKRDFHYKHQSVIKLFKWFNQLFPEDDKLQFFLKYCASILRKRNSEKIFLIMTGRDGNNSKSMIIKLFEATFGTKSCIQMNVETIANGTRRGGSGPNPELARVGDADIVIIPEPDDDIQLRKGIIKLLTGGDRFFGRKCNQDGGDVDNKAKMLLMCNDPPGVYNADKAIFNRVVLLSIASIWVKEPPKDEKEQIKLRIFQLDPFFNKEIPELAPAFLWLLGNVYDDYIKHGLDLPYLMEKDTKDYWERTDPYYKFSKEKCTVIDSDDNEVKCYLKEYELFNKFKRWFKDNYPGEKPVEETACIKAFEHRWGFLEKGKGFKNRKIIEENIEFTFAKK